MPRLPLASFPYNPLAADISELLNKKLAYSYIGLSHFLGVRLSNNAATAYLPTRDYTGLYLQMQPCLPRQCLRDNRRRGARWSRCVPALFRPGFYRTGERLREIKRGH